MSHHYISVSASVHTSGSVKVALQIALSYFERLPELNVIYWTWEHRLFTDWYQTHYRIALVDRTAKIVRLEHRFDIHDSWKKEGDPMKSYIASLFTELGYQVRYTKQL